MPSRRRSSGSHAGATSIERPRDARVAMGAFGALGHWLLVLAHARAPAAVLAPFIYTQIVWTVALGYLVFGDVPGERTLVGSAIVIASGAYLLHRERARGAVLRA